MLFSPFSSLTRKTVEEEEKPLHLNMGTVGRNGKQKITTLFKMLFTVLEKSGVGLDTFMYWREIPSLSPRLGWERKEGEEGITRNSARKTKAILSYLSF